MAKNDIRRWIVFGGLVTGLLEHTGGFSRAADPSPKPCADTDLAALEASAAAGNPGAQTRLADHYSAVADFAKAADWYRQAASRGELEAQLSLASCYLGGLGVEKNPHEAARWLRAAASCLEQAPPTLNVASSQPPQPPRNPPLRLSSDESTAAPAANPPGISRTSSRVQRVLTVQVVSLELQDSAQPLRLLKATP